MSDRASFLRSIAEVPDDDTRRLGFADYCDENGDHLRAELIRVQMELHGELSDIPDRHHNNLDMILDPQSSEDQTWKHRVWSLQKRASALLAARAADWLKVPCAACGGAGHIKRAPYPNEKNVAVVRAECVSCSGTGDAGGLTWTFNQPIAGHHDGNYGWVGNPTPLKVDWSKGFPHRVHCRLGDVAGGEAVTRFHGPGATNPYRADVWEPTAFALAVVRHHPVTEFRVDVPFAQDEYGWQPNSWFMRQVPRFLFDMIQGHDSSTADAAHTAMATALGSWVRSYAYTGAIDAN